MKKLSLVIILAVLLQVFLPAPVTATHQYNVSVVPDSIDFGWVAVNTSSAAETVTITNHGPGDVSIESVYLTGIYTVHFQITEDNASGMVLGKNESATVAVEFHPLLAGQKNAFLRIQGACGFCAYVNLAGTGVSLTDVDLAITKTGSPDPVAAGYDLTYNVDIVNNGPGDASDVYVFDIYPAGVFSATATTPSQGTVSQDLPQWALDILAAEFGITVPPPEYEYLTWSVGDMANGATASLAITATVSPDIVLPDASPIINRAIIFSDNEEWYWDNNYTEISTASRRRPSWCRPPSPWNPNPP